MVYQTKIDCVKKYIDENDKNPSVHDKDIKVSCLGTWLNHQRQNYIAKKQSMANSIIYDKWSMFINDEKYSKYFQSNEAAWEDKLNRTKQYIDKYVKRPSTRDTNDNIKQLGRWLQHQQEDYCTKKHIMATEKIYEQWIDFINDDKYSKYFQSNEAIWQDKLKYAKWYIDEYTKLPSTCAKNIEFKQLAYWIAHQRKNYITKIKIMKSKLIYDKWTEFITNEKYKKYFI